MVVACMLHDVGYSIDFKDVDDYYSHGRHGARITRPFLYELGYSKEEVEEMCYGIVIHVDDVADLEHDRTTSALTINECDNIDRFDAYRLYESMHLADYINLSIENQKDFLKEMIGYLREIRKYKLATKIAQNRWEEKIDFQLKLLKKLSKQTDKIKMSSILEENDGI